MIRLRAIRLILRRSAIDLPACLVVLVAERVALAVDVRVQTELLTLILVFDLLVQRVYRLEHPVAHPLEEAHGVRLLHAVRSRD